MVIDSKGRVFSDLDTKHPTLSCPFPADFTHRRAFQEDARARGSDWGSRGRARYDDPHWYRGWTLLDLPRARVEEGSKRYCG